jgi:O-antigen ligase
VLELPLIGLSLSAPIFYFIAVRVYVAEGGVSADRNRHWYVFAFVFWTALVGSLIGNLLAGPAFVIDTADIAILVRFAYWLLVFVATAHLVATIEEPRRIALALALGVVALGGVRLVEVVLFGNWGAWTGTRFMAQNEYGLQFSIFTPFALALPLVARGRARWLSVPAIGLICVAVAGNGSRSSWIALAVAVVGLIVLSALSGNRRARRLWRPIALIALLAIAAPIFLPGRVVAPIVQRYETFQRLDTDRSYQIRLLMLQKSMRLFEESPVFGAGIGRFHRTSVELDRPGILGRSEGIYNRRSSHNSYAGLFGETGLIGTVPFALLLLTLLVGGGRASLRLARAGESWALAAYVSLLTMSVHLIAISALTNTTVWFIYGMMAGVIGRSRLPVATAASEF